MSILIRSMETPTSCDKCRFCVNGFTDAAPMYECAVQSYENVSVLVESDGKPFNFRPDWCPLIEVKEPHGDLVDKDKLMKEFMDSDLDHLQRDDWKEVIQIVSDAPTITPEPHWIPVEQELPEYGVDCIVTVKQKYPWQTDWEYFIDLGWRGDYIDGAWDTTNDWDEGQETHISAWMPAPEPYKGVTE